MDDKDRKFVISTGKEGVLLYFKAFYESIGMTKEEVKTKIEKDRLELPDGCYTIR